MLHRQKIIGKSIYRIVSEDGVYRIMELYPYRQHFITKTYGNWDRVDDAIRELESIDRERQYTDEFFL